jgi:hypothetical protein
MTSIASMFVIVTLRFTYLLSSHGETMNAAHDRFEGDYSCLLKLIGYSGLFFLLEMHRLFPPCCLLLCLCVCVYRGDYSYR